MATPRRLYIYLVSAISLQAFVWAIIDLLRGMLIAPLISSPTALALHIAIILVSLPIYLIHWLWGQRLANRDREEREASLRVLYLYGMQAAFLIPLIMSTFSLITTILLWIAGEPPRRHYPELATGESILFFIMSLVVLGLFLYYHQRIIQQDSRVVQLKGGAATIRRLYVFGFSAVGLAMTTMGFMYILRGLLFLIGGGFAAGMFRSTAFMSDLARLIVGVPLWLFFWLWAQRLFVGGEEEERQSVLRKFYLYAVIFIAVISIVSSITLILEGLFSRILVGSTPTSGGDIRIPISIIVTMVILWVYHSRVLKEDIKVAEEIERQAGLRRLYTYLIAGVGLSAFVVGIGGILSVLIRSLDQAAFGSGLREQLSLFVALTITGLPVWYLPWKQSQDRASAAGSSGMSERGSLVRKIYLYFFLFIATSTILSSLVYIIFRIISMVLGETFPSFTDLGQAIAFSLVALGLWVYHWSILQNDQQRSTQDARKEIAAASVVLVDYGAQDFNQRLMAELSREKLDLILVSLDIGESTPKANAAENREENLVKISQAGIIVGSWEMLVPDQVKGANAPEMVSAVTNSPAVKLMVPTRSEGWEWAGVDQWNTEYYVRQTVNSVKQIIENKVVKPNRGLGTGAIIGIVIGIIFLLLLLGIPTFALFGGIF